MTAWLLTACIFSAVELAPPNRTFTIKDGLPDLNVTSFALADNGMLYATTQAGIARYNGTRWRALELPAKLASVDFRAIAFVNGRPYAGSVGVGLIALEPAEALQVKLPSQEVFALASLPDGALAMGTSAGVAIARPKDQFAIERSINTPRVNGLAFAKGWLFIAHEQGLTALAVATGERRDFAELSGVNVNCVGIAGDRVFAGTQDFIDELSAVGLRYVRRYKEMQGSRQVFQLLPPSPALSAEMAGITLDGTLLLLRDGVWAKQSLFEGVIFAATFTHSPVPLLWLGTTAGVVRVTFSGFEKAKEPTGRRATAVAKLDDGRVVIGTEKDVVQLAPHRIYDAKDAGVGELHAFAVRGHGHTALIATRIGAVLALENGRMTNLGLQLRPFDSVFSFADYRGDLLALTRVGVHRFDGKKWSPLPGAPQTAIFAAVETKRSLLLATESAVLRYRDGQTEDFGALPNNNVLTAASVPREDGREELWLGTNGGGVMRVLEQGVEVITTPQLPNATINALAVEKDNSVWIGTGYGLVHARCEASTCQLRRYGTDDGLPADDISWNGVSIDDLGRVWVATAQGLAVVTPSAIAEPKKESRLMFERVLVNGIVRDFTASAELTYKEALVRFDFVLPMLFRGEQTAYATQLVGIEGERSPFGESLFREFTSLPAGSYALNIWARDYAGNEYGPEQSAFTVLPPPWRTWWAYAVYCVVVAGAVMQATRVRIKQLRRRAEELEKVVEQRTAQVVKQKDEILAQKHELEESYRQADRIFAQLKDALKGSLLDERYKLEAELGQGGFGVVYKAVEVRTGEHYAVKVFRPTAGNDSVEALERFKQEAKSAQRIKHKNAIVIHDSGVSKDNIAFIAMELLHGQSLKQMMQSRGKLDLPTCHSVSVAVASALAAAHAAGVVHRDIKPDNVFMHEGANGIIPKVLDFGVAKQTGAKAGGTLTMTGSVVGTPTYIAPERLEDKPYDGRSDVYSLGIMMYEMLSGEPPFRSVGDNVFSIVMQHLQQAPAPLVAFDSTIPVAVHELVMRTMAKNPSERPNAEELVEELDRAFGGHL